MYFYKKMHNSMTKKINYTFDECKTIASSFNNRKDFHTFKRTCFNYSKKNGMV